MDITERGDPSVSMDLLVHSLFALGVTRKELAKAIGSKNRSEKLPALTLDMTHPLE